VHDHHLRAQQADGRAARPHAGVILDPADYDRWLDLPVPGAEELLRPCLAEWLEAVPVSTRVNSPCNDDESIIQTEDKPLGTRPALL
jgi:putative SOS response-associated peptidase YedK